MMEKLAPAAAPDFPTPHLAPLSVPNFAIIPLPPGYSLRAIRFEVLATPEGPPADRKNHDTIFTGIIAHYWPHGCWFMGENTWSEWLTPSMERKGLAEALGGDGPGHSHDR